MRFLRKKVSTISSILSVVFFFLAITFYSIAWSLFQLGITEAFTRASAGMLYELYVLSLIAGTVTIAGCLVCLYLAIRLPKTKILRETYFFAVFVPLFSILSHIVLNVVLKIFPPPEVIVVLGIIVATPLSCVLAGYSERTLWMKLRSLGLNQGITILSLIFIVSIPIIEISPKVSTFALQSSGTIIGTVFESGNDTAKVQGQIAKSVFTAEVPIPSDTIFIAKQVVNVTNQCSNSLDLRIYLEDLSGNLSKVKQLKIFFTLENGSEICPLSLNDGNVKYEEAHLSMKSHATITMGVISLAQNVSSTNITVMSLLMKFDDHNLGMNILIDSL